jgi:TM2 domain-containing membrane protein YozV
MEEHSSQSTSTNSVFIIIIITFHTPGFLIVSLDDSVMWLKCVI